jgi:hypothetical protein
MLLTVCHSHIPVGRLLVFLKINRSFLVWGEENEGKICKQRSPPLGDLNQLTLLN